jgi:hypothetical protein
VAPEALDPAGGTNCSAHQVGSHLHSGERQGAAAHRNCTAPPQGVASVYCQRPVCEPRAGSAAMAFQSIPDNGAP